MWGVKVLLWLVAVLLVSSFLTSAQDSAEKRDKDYEDKPYKFGFSIENYLHREEEKDAAGLVHGEFGFVTGDGVYHVTAYATDENGDFKILKMKSYYVGLPGVDGPAVKKDDSGKQLPPMKMNPSEPIPPSGIMGCGSCIIPTAEPPTKFIQPPQVNNQDQNQYSQDPNQYPQDPNQYSNQYPQDPNQYYNNQNQYYQDPNQYPQDPNQYPQDPNQYPQDPNQYPQDPNQYYNNQNYQDPNQSVYPSFQPVLQDNGQSFPDIGKEVSNSISSDDMLRLLYRFNYTIGFHGHHEEGDLVGNKKGGYFINGRDGYGRKFTYIANEFGYQPRVTLEDLSGDAVPKEQTEKDAKFGLKGYEFRWFY